MGRVKKAGRKKDEYNKLTVMQERMIIEKMMDSIQNNYDNKPFWTRKSVKNLIEKELNMNISISSVGDYLKRWNLLDNKIISMKNKAIQARDTIRIWLQEVYPCIEKKARKENADILWIRSSYRIKFPEELIKKSLQYESWKIKCFQLKIVAPYGEKAFLLSSSRYNGYDFVNFLKKLISYSDKKIYLIIKTKKMYPIKPIKTYLDDNSDKIELHYAPYT